MHIHHSDASKCRTSSVIFLMAPHVLSLLSSLWWNFINRWLPTSWRLHCTLDHSWLLITLSFQVRISVQVLAHFSAPLVFSFSLFPRSSEELQKSSCFCPRVHSTPGNLVFTPPLLPSSSFFCLLGPLRLLQQYKTHTHGCIPSPSFPFLMTDSLVSVP